MLHQGAVYQTPDKEVIKTRSVLNYQALQRQSFLVKLSVAFPSDGFSKNINSIKNKPQIKFCGLKVVLSKIYVVVSQFIMPQKMQNGTRINNMIRITLKRLGIAERMLSNNSEIKITAIIPPNGTI